MERTTIMLPSELKTRASNQALKKGVSLGRYIRDALRSSLDRENEGLVEHDTLFRDDVVYLGDAPGDLAVNHDRYLYGDGG